MISVHIVYQLWDLEVVDVADRPSDVDNVFELEPLKSLRVGTDTSIQVGSCTSSSTFSLTMQFQSMFKSTEIGADEFSSVWYVQDTKGAIWRVDLAHSHTVKLPQRILSFHSGKINGLDVCPTAHLAATTGDDGTVRIHDYIAKSTLCSVRGEPDSAGTCLIWVPLQVSSHPRLF